MSPPAWLQLFERPFPSGNIMLIRGSRPVLVDAGFGSDLEETEGLLRATGVEPADLHLIVSSHYHSDHAGGIHGLQRRYGIPVAAHRWEADLINRRDPQAGAAEWLGQPIEPYTVQRPVSDGDVIDAGGVALEVIHTPGHTLGHIALHAPEDRVVLCGDAVHREDVGWVNLFREGVGALRRAAESVTRLAGLRPRWACSGHGPPMEEPEAAYRTALERYERWSADPHKPAWHGCKRIFAFALMIRGGLEREEVEPYLLSAPWFVDYSRHVFDTSPEAFVESLLEEMLRSGAAGWDEGRLVALTPHVPPPEGWPAGPTRPKAWPPSDANVFLPFE